MHAFVVGKSFEEFVVPPICAKVFSINICWFRLNTISCARVLDKETPTYLCCCTGPNIPPVAVDDLATTRVATAVTVNVLENDLMLRVTSLT